jgi:hypothetical protein
MYNFLSVIILRDGSVVHDEENSHSKAVELAKIKEPDQFRARLFWEWEWDGVGEFKLEKHFRCHVTKTPEAVLKTALRLAKRLPLALEYGKFLDSEFKNMPSVRARSKNWEGCITWKNGRQDWWKNGKRHREDGPAVVFPDGTQEWWKNGELHREDGPAIIYSDGLEEWWKNEKLHREDGPAVVFSNGDQWWYHKGVRHREDGPAVVRKDGTQEWWKDGEQYYPQKGTVCATSCQ